MIKADAVPEKDCYIEVGLTKAEDGSITKALNYINGDCDFDVDKDLTIPDYTTFTVSIGYQIPEVTQPASDSSDKGTMDLMTDDMSQLYAY